MMDETTQPTVHLKVLGYMELEDSSGRAVVSVLKRPKLAALLSVLAVGDSAVRSRERLMAMFWPETEPSKAAHSLNQLVYRLRKEIGDVIERRGDQLVIDPNFLACDVRAFDEAIDGGDVRAAVELYRGDFLEGLFVSDAPEFERWVETQRRRLSRASEQAHWSLAEAFAAEGELVEASTLARRAASCTPGEEATMRRLLGFLDGIGDRTGALAAYDDFARYVRDEFDATPSPETEALVREIRGREDVVAELSVRRPQVGEWDQARRSDAKAGPSTTPTTADSSRDAQWTWWWIAVPVAVVGALLLGRMVPSSGVEERETASTVLAFDVSSVDGTPEADAVARALVSELTETPRFEVVTDSSGGTQVDARVQVTPFQDEGARWVEVRLIAPEDGLIAAARSFSVSDGATPLVRFVRERAGMIRSEVALARSTSPEEREALRTVDRLIREAQDDRILEGVPTAWAKMAAADTILISLQSTRPDWVEPPRRRGWLALERAMTLSFASEEDSISLGFVPGPVVWDAIYDEAEALAEHVVQLSGEAALGYALRGAVHYSRWQLSVASDAESEREALADLRRAVDIDPFLPEAWVRLGRIRTVAGDHAAALVAIERAVEADPYLQHDPSTQQSLLFALVALDEQGRARTTCADGARLFPNDVDFQECALFLEATLGTTSDVERAQRLYDELLGGPSDATWRPLRMMYLAAAAVRGGDSDRARQLLEDVSALPPESIGNAAALQRVRVLSLLGDLDEATDSLSAIVQQLPGIARSVPLDRRFDGLRGHPAYDQLVDSLRAND